MYSNKYILEAIEAIKIWQNSYIDLCKYMLLVKCIKWFWENIDKVFKHAAMFY